MSLCAVPLSSLTRFTIAPEPVLLLQRLHGDSVVKCVATISDSVVVSCCVDGRIKVFTTAIHEETINSD